MSKYRAYPIYKDSGVEWLGEVPEHWQVKRLRFAINSNPVKSELIDFDINELVSFIPMENVGEYGGIALTHEKPLSDVYMGYTYFAENDVILAKITPCFENGKGAIAKGLTNGIAFGTTELHVIRPLTGYSEDFLFYVSISHPFRNIGASEMFGAGGQKRVPESFIKDFRFGLPDIKEQQQIAAFLDNKTSHLDTLIEKKQQMIGLLNEKRIALITQAVTKGLDLSVPMKDSGVEWLGNVPEHWKIWKLKFSVDLITGKANAKESELQFIGLESIESFTGKIIISDSELESEGIALCYQANDVLFCKLRPYLAKVYLATQAGLCTSELLVLRGIKVIPTFLKYYILSQEFINIVDSSTYGSKMPRANWDFIGNLPCLIPYDDEQEKIVDYLDQETAKIDRMINTVQTAIAKLQEYRTALITAAVTGKIDVRTITPHEG